MANSAKPAALEGPSAIGLLADPTTRAIITALGESRGQPLAASSLTEESPVGVTARLVRDRVRELERDAILESAGRGTAGTTRWDLGAAGQDLFRLQSLMTRIIERAAGHGALTPTSTRERVIEQTLRLMSDPVVLQLARCLAGSGPLDPVALEEACRPTPRRTLYRRLGLLVDAGAVIRSTTRRVPRSTHYELAGQWRPAAAIPLLAAWWGLRHPAPGAARGPEVDLEGLLLAVLPIAHVAGARAGDAVRWTISGPRPREHTIVAADAGDRLELLGPTGGAGARAATRAAVSGSPGEWASALVTDQRGGLVIAGDAPYARELLNAVRAALLSYVR